MKKIYLLTLILLAAVTGWSQTTVWTNGNNNNRWDQAGNWSNGIPTTNSTVVFNNGNTFTVINVAASGSVTLDALRIEGNTNVTLTNTNNNRTLTVRNGAGAYDFFVESGSELTLTGGGGGNGVSVTMQNNSNSVGRIEGTLTVDNNRAFNTSNATVTTVTGTIVNGETVNSTNSSRLVFAAGSTYIHAQNGGTIPTSTWNTTSTCRIEGVTNTMPSDYTQDFGNFVWSCAGQTSGLSFAGGLNVINGDFIVENTGSGDLRLKQSGGTTSTTVGGNFVLSGGTLYIIQSNNTHTLEVAGNVTISSGTLARAGGGGAIGNFVFNGSSEQIFTKTGGTISGAVNFTVNSGASVNFGTSLLDGTSATFTLSSGAKIITSNAAGLASTGASGSIRVGGTRTYSNGADYEFRGAATGSFTTTNSDVRDLIINNTSGQVSMGRNFNVTRALTLTNGYVTPGANTLLVGTAGTSTSSNGAYVNGRLSKQFNNTTGFTFYVGKVSGGLRSIGFTPTSGTGTSTFVAEFLRASGAVVGSVYGSGISRVSQCEYWTLNRNVGGNRVGRVTLSWDVNSNCGTAPYVTNLGMLRVARHDGSAWTNAGSINGADFGSSLTSGFITSDEVTSFSPFALATSNAAENPLPVMFADVKAYSKNNGVQVEWSNLTEREILNYEVERSANGIDFYAVNLQLPRSNRDDKASYTFFDANPVNGANYYRVRVQEQTGKVIYSKILRVEMGSTKYSFSLYPNPVTGNQLTLSLNGVKQGKYNVQIIDAAGQRIFTTNLSNVGTGVTQMIELPASVKTGMYVMIVSGDDYRETKQFIVR